MCGAVDICSVFHLDCLFQVGNKPPELLLDVFLGNRPMALENRVEWHLVLEVALLEISSLFLELLERVKAALLEAKLPIANETPCAIPLCLWFGLQRGVETGTVVPVIA